MSNYNLTDDVSDDFTFSIAGVAYKMRYPRIDELEILRDMVGESNKLEEEKLKAIQSEKDTEVVDKKIKKLEDKINGWVYSFVSPEQEDSKPIEEVMKTVNVKVMVNFQTMFKIEFGLE